MNHTMAVYDDILTIILLDSINSSHKDVYISQFHHL